MDYILLIFNEIPFISIHSIIGAFLWYTFIYLLQQLKKFLRIKGILNMNYPN